MNRGVSCDCTIPATLVFSMQMMVGVLSGEPRPARHAVLAGRGAYV